MFSIKNIKLSTRTTLLFSSGLILIFCLSISLTWFFFLREINQLELHATIETNQQAQQTIQIKLDDMAQRSGDWAFWDETYRLTTQGDATYHERNLNADSLIINDVDLMIFLSRTGEYIDGAYLNAARNRAGPVNQTVLDKLLSSQGIGRQFNLLIHQSQPELRAISGVITLWNDPMLIVISPITQGNMTSNVGGWMIWAKRVHLFFPERYKTVLGNDTQLINLFPSGLPKEIDLSLFQQHTAFANQLTDTQLSVFSVLYDINKQPAAVIKITAPREYYQSGKTALWWLVVACLISSLIVGGFFFRELRRSLSNRLHTLEHGLHRLAQNDYSQLLHSDDNQDEIAMVSQVVNKLLMTKIASSDALAESKSKFSAIYENASLPMLIAYEKRVFSANQAVAEMLGYDNANALTGEHIDKLLSFSGKQTGNSSDLFYQHIRENKYHFEWDIVGHLGWLVPCELNITPIEQDGQQALLICMNDISERRLQENKIRRLVFNDALTGLNNRYALLQRMKPVLEQRSDEHQFALLYINLDRFHAINDTFGHDIGDGVIKTVALRLSMQCESLTVARIAGDEFIVFIPEIQNSYQPVRLSRDINTLMRQPMTVNNVDLEISTTISVIIGGHEYESVEDVLRCADFAMTRAKKQNKRILLFSHRLYKEAIETLTIQRDLPFAIRNQLVKPEFQPIVSCITGEIVGFEALARWHHDELGPISPVRFIPIAEESNLIIELGEQILKQSCLFIKQFNQMRAAIHTPPLSVHVNFSAHHFSSSALLDNLQTIFEQVELDTKHLVIEITESMVIERPDESVRRMEQIKKMGIKLALDDFGTGYSALNTLCQYPLDIVKLDRSFVLRLMDGQQGEVLVRAIVNMARDLKLEMVAEGVETREQMLKIKALGVEEIQGFYYYRPMPANDIFALFDVKKSAKVLEFQSH